VTHCLLLQVLFSYKGYHAMPTYLNVLNNALLRANVDSRDPYVYGIKTLSHPFATTSLQKFQKALESYSFIVNPLGMMFALAFLVCGYCVLLIEERTHKFFHLQEIAGVNKVIYYISAYIWDSVGYSLFIALSLALFLAFQDPSFTSPDIFPYFAFIMFLFGHALIPWVYSLSLFFSSPTTAFIVLFCLYFFGGFSLMIINTIIFLLIDNDTYGAYLMLWPLPPLPTYTLSRAFGYLTYDYNKKVITSTYNPLAEPISVGSDLAPYVGALIAYAVFGWILLMVSEYIVIPRVLPLLKCCCGNRDNSDDNCQSSPEEADVARERERVSQGNTGNDVLTTCELSKSYFGHSRLAVNNLTFGVKKGECFGLLGVNGAGKTSTFKMLTGDLSPSSGTAFVNGFDVKKRVSGARSELGYCPQFDGILDSLTGRQHLELFARVRGYHGRKLTNMVDRTLDQLQLSEYSGRVVGAYSGGNKRKLSTAIALLAQPKIVLLDEPTAGVDPEARRFLWRVIQDVVGSGQSVLLTTHSMAECEVLCSRVAIMVNGRLMCLGSPQRLKEK
jgi:ABC-type multidrug transport system ATPase subunit